MVKRGDELCCLFLEMEDEHLEGCGYPDVFDRPLRILRKRKRRRRKGLPFQS
ncbi:MAG: hypothetical protein ACLU8D_10625 [Enterocloster sp.]